ncbi:MAG: permease-like cell division protein FtsX [Candidatus Eremiobacteraeota bacterium]|nr:permease-like cell division protein FtsX [Candidatus Eremiobacteraeota bacterium]
MTYSAYFFREVLTNIRRSPLMSIASVTTVLVLTLILGYFTAVMVNLEALANSLLDEVQVVAYLDDDANQVSVAQQLERIPGVQKAHFVSKETALNKLVERMQGRIKVDDLTRNPLPDSYEVSVASADDLELVAKRSERIAGVARVKYGEEIAQRMLRFNALVRGVGVVVLGLLFLSTVLIVSNTIRLTVFARRKEIEIMQMVGAAEWFIRWPFILEGVLQGLLGSVVAAIVVGGSYAMVIPKLTETISFLPMVEAQSMLPTLLPVLILNGAFVGALGSLVSVNKFLKV